VLFSAFSYEKQLGSESVKHHGIKQTNKEDDNGSS